MLLEILKTMTAQDAMRPPTAIVMLNLGGPATLDDVEPFLLKLFADREIMPLPFQGSLGPWIAKRRAPKVRERYTEIGGGSPILYWTRLQGEGMVRLLDQLSPETAPHKFYPAFRYAYPFSEDVIQEMKADGVERAVAFTQYPQYSCATTGSSLNELWRAVRKLGLEREFKWSVIDRWPTHPGFIAEVWKSIEEGLTSFPESEQGDVLLLFSAHSLPLNIVNRGDAYPQEVGASVHAVMQSIDFSNEYLLSYQSSVGPVQWLGPSTESILQKLGAQKRRNVLVVPIAFTSDHIETLHEIDIEFKELAEKAGITNFKRARALNDSPGFQQALAEIVSTHLQAGEICSSQYGLRCPGCTNPACKVILNPVLPDGHPMEGIDFSPEVYPHNIKRKANPFQLFERK